jgi:sugar phosphate isomerase/epimerase
MKNCKSPHPLAKPWIEEIEAYVDSGRGSTRDLRRCIEDLGLKVAGAVDFAEWVVPDDARRAAGLERMKRDMELVAQIGGSPDPSPIESIWSKVQQRLRSARARTDEALVARRWVTRAVGHARGRSGYFEYCGCLVRSAETSRPLTSRP